MVEGGVSFVHLVDLWCGDSGGETGHHAWGGVKGHNDGLQINLQTLFIDEHTIYMYVHVEQTCTLHVKTDLKSIRVHLVPSSIILFTDNDLFTAWLILFEAIVRTGV